MKKYLKIILVAISVLFPIAFVIGFSKSWTSFETIIAAGSTSVQPLMSALGDSYQSADVIVQPGGSSFGLKVAAENSKDLGNSSKNPYEAVQNASIEQNGFDKKMWETNWLKTITIAWDGIAIVYKPYNNNDPILTVSEKNIQLIYETFSGFKKHKLYELFNNSQNEINFFEKYKEDNNFITPYSRSGGSQASGTAHSFANESDLDTNINNQDLIQSKKILGNGSYGKNVVATAESNIESWNRIKNDNKSNSMIYLSLGFVQKNKKIIEKSGYKIANYLNKNNEIVVPSIANISNKKYMWFNPINTILPLKKATQKTKDFVWWMVSNANVNVLIEKFGYASLMNEDKSKMFSQKIIDWNYIDNYKDDFFSEKSTDIELSVVNNIHSYGVPK